MIKVSVVVPVYNVEEYLDECLKSLVEQTLSEIEIIVVNDGSPDNSQQIINSYAERYPDKILALQKENGGLSDARNFGIAHAHGEFIGFVDSDDFVERDMFEALYKSAKKNQSEVVIGQYKHYALSGGPITKGGVFPFNENKVYSGRDFLLNSHIMLVCNKIYKSDLIKQYPFPTTWFEDVAWSPVIMSYAKKISYIPRSFYHYIRREGTIASSHDNLRTLEGISSIKYALSNCNPDEKDAVAYMAIKRLFFEARVRSGYADHYMNAFFELKDTFSNNRFYYDDCWYYLNAQRYFDKSFQLIPKVVYYEHFEKQILTDSEKKHILSWSEKLMYSDGKIICLDENNCCISENEKILKAYNKQKYDVVGMYFKLKFIQQYGGIGLTTKVSANNFIAPILHKSNIFFAYSDYENISFDVFGSIPNHPIICEILEYILINLDEDNVIQRAFNTVVSKYADCSYQYSQEVDFNKSYLDYSRDVALYPSSVLTHNYGGKYNITFLDFNDLTDIEFYKTQSKFHIDTLSKYCIDYYLHIKKPSKKTTKKSVLKNIAQKMNFVKGTKKYVVLQGGWHLIKKIVIPIYNMRKNYVSYTKKYHSYKKNLSNLINQYAKEFDTNELSSKLVLFESFYGRGLISSPYALFCAWEQRADFNDYQFVWALDKKEYHQSVIKTYLEKYSNIMFVERGDKEYFTVLSKAKYLINDVSFFFDFIKKPEQVYLNTWHSITVKTLGFDIPDQPLSSKNVIRNFLACDYYLAPNDFMRDKIFLSSHKMLGLFPGSIVQEGHPRNDLTFNTSRDEIKGELITLGISFDPLKKTIVYAPTWRGKNGNNPTDNINEYINFISVLEKSIDMNEYNVLLRVHQLAYIKLRNNETISKLLIPSTVDANRMFSMTDILITDYSSIYFDYLVTGRPILFYIPDLEEYSLTRGVYFSEEELPGPVAKCAEDICDYINHLESYVGQYKRLYQKVKEWACPKDDGNVSCRILNALLDSDGSYTITKSYDQAAPKILLYAGELKDNNTLRIAEEIISFIKKDNKKYDISILITDSNNPTVNKNVQRLLDNDIRPIGRSGKYMVYRKEEIASICKLDYQILAKQDKKKVDIFMSREWRRCFGDSTFDISICCITNTNDLFYSYLLLNGNSTHKILCKSEKLFSKDMQIQKIFNKLSNFHDMACDNLFTLYTYLKGFL